MRKWDAVMQQCKIRT